MSLTDLLTARLRTVVPSAWAAVLVWLAAQGVPAELVDRLGPLGEAVLLPVAVWAVYSAARWVEAQPWAPRWLVRLLLGSTHQPVYPPRPPVDPVP